MHVADIPQSHTVSLKQLDLSSTMLQDTRQVVSGSFDPGVGESPVTAPPQIAQPQEPASTVSERSRGGPSSQPLAHPRPSGNPNVTARQEFLVPSEGATVLMREQLTPEAQKILIDLFEKGDGPARAFVTALWQRRVVVKKEGEVGECLALIQPDADVRVAVRATLQQAEAGGWEISAVPSMTTKRAAESGQVSDTKRPELVPPGQTPSTVAPNALDMGKGKERELVPGTPRSQWVLSQALKEISPFTGKRYMHYFDEPSRQLAAQTFIDYIEQGIERDHLNPPVDWRQVHPDDSDKSAREQQLHEQDLRRVLTKIGQRTAPPDRSKPPEQQSSAQLADCYKQTLDRCSSSPDGLVFLQPDEIALLPRRMRESIASQAAGDSRVLRDDNLTLLSFVQAHTDLLRLSNEAWEVIAFGPLELGKNCQWARRGGDLQVSDGSDPTFNQHAEQRHFARFLVDKLAVGFPVGDLRLNNEEQGLDLGCMRWLLKRMRERGLPGAGDALADGSDNIAALDEREFLARCLQTVAETHARNTKASKPCLPLILSELIALPEDLVEAFIRSAGWIDPRYSRRDFLGYVAEKVRPWMPDDTYLPRSYREGEAGRLVHKTGAFRYPENDNVMAKMKTRLGETKLDGGRYKPSTQEMALERATGFVRRQERRRSAFATNPLRSVIDRTKPVPNTSGADDTADPTAKERWIKDAAALFQATANEVGFTSYIVQAEFLFRALASSAIEQITEGPGVVRQGATPGFTSSGGVGPSAMA